MNGVADGPHAPWRDKIPDRWEVIPGLAAVRENKRRNTGIVEETVLSLSYGRIVIKPPEKLTGLVPASFETYQVMKPGDIVIRTTDLQNDWTSLRVGLVKNPGIITSAYVGLQPTERYSPEFLYYLLHSYDTKKVFYGMGSGLRQNIGFDDFKWLPFICPPRPEQDAIVAYLDGKLEAIDRYLRVKEREMALLEERKRALIHRAVTRGLDPNPQLQPSGIPWLPEIPAGWRPVKAGFYVEILSGYAFPSVGFTHDENDIVLLRGINVGVGSVRWDEVVRWPRDAARSLSRFALREGDLVMGMDRPWISAGMRVAQISSEDLPCLLLQRVARLRAKAPLTQAFLQLVLSTDLFIDYFTPILTGVSVPHLSPDQIGNFRFGLPSTGEQDSIVKLVEENATKIDTTITRAGRQIERMQEYRTALIAEAVTGKIDVTTRPN